jgi:hypothetical protein
MLDIAMQQQPLYIAHHLFRGDRQPPSQRRKADAGGDGFSFYPQDLGPQPHWKSKVVY